MTVEQKVSETILQKPSEVTAGGRTYRVAPPSVATLILASEGISRLPAMDAGDDPVEQVRLSLETAKDCAALGDILAVLILGAKAVREWDEGRGRRPRLFRRRGRKSPRETLARELLEEHSPRELTVLARELVRRMEIGDFFVLTTFLRGASLTARTKVGTGTTASGR